MSAPKAISLRATVGVVALLNILYFFAELTVALRIDSVSLLADSADFFEDAALNFLVLFALGWSARKRAGVGALLAGVLLVPAVAFVWTLLAKFQSPAPPESLALTLTGTGALLVNVFCAFLLARHRGEAGSLSKAAFLSARNDALANMAIIVAGLATMFLWPSIWPDIVVGLAIAVINADSARTVWNAAREERRLSAAPAPPFV